MIDEVLQRQYEARALSIRKRMVCVAEKCNEQIHWGGSLSSVEIMTILAFENVKKGDIVVMSKGHAALAVYSAYEEAGLLPADACLQYQQDGGVLSEELEMNADNYIECSTGSLGIGLSYCVGKAIRFKREQCDKTVYCVVGDGECNEGSVWEAIMLASQQKLDNLILIVDCNGLQLCGPTKDIINMDNLDERLNAFGWKSVVSNGHDFYSLDKALNSEHYGIPLAVIAKTV